jgi:hypothetical protein
MWPTILMEICCQDKWKWTYHHEPYREEALMRDFPTLPLDYEGSCKHGVGIENGRKFHCCVCGYTIVRR